jgi:hypothetical protein
MILQFGLKIKFCKRQFTIVHAQKKSKKEGIFAYRILTNPKLDDALQPVANEAGQIYKWRYRGNRRYELCNHLGNVKSVITDKKIPYDDGTRWKYYTADMVSITDKRVLCINY